MSSHTAFISPMAISPTMGKQFVLLIFPLHSKLENEDPYDAVKDDAFCKRGGGTGWTSGMTARRLTTTFVVIVFRTFMLTIISNFHESLYYEPKKLALVDSNYLADKFIKCRRLSPELELSFAPCDPIRCKNDHT